MQAIYEAFMENFSDVIKQKLSDAEWTTIATQRGGTFRARCTPKGVEVDCLGSNSIIEWGAFDAIQLLLRRSPSSSAARGSAMNSRLGDIGLPTDSVEGCVAVYYGRKEGDSIFRRISPIANLLVWAGLCRHGRGKLISNRPL